MVHKIEQFSLLDTSETSGENSHKSVEDGERIGEERKRGARAVFNGDEIVTLVLKWLSTFYKMVIQSFDRFMFDASFEKP